MEESPSSLGRSWAGHQPGRWATSNIANTFLGERDHTQSYGPLLWRPAQQCLCAIQHNASGKEGQKNQAVDSSRRRDTFQGTKNLS